MNLGNNRSEIILAKNNFKFAIEPDFFIFFESSKRAKNDLMISEQNFREMGHSEIAVHVVQILG